MSGKIFLTILLTILSSFGVFSQMTNTKSEEEDVKSVIMNQTKSWADKNYQGVADAWAHENFIIETYPGPFYYAENISWASVDSAIKNDFKYNPKPMNTEFQWSDWNIRIFKDIAWASYIQKFQIKNERPNLSREIRILEKINGVWKLVHVSAIYKSDYARQSKDAEADLNEAGYKLMGMNKIDESIEVFKMNAKLYPQSSYVYTGLGEAYSKKGDKKLATKNFKTSLSLNPDDEYVKDLLDNLSKK